jgi:dTDP-4-amino-4,6-dideoxygalactose transaminase
MAAILVDIQPGDEVIMPSYTFVSTANAFILRGAKIVFADSQEEHPNVSVIEVGRLIARRTKAIVVVHYAGVACDMDAIMEIAASRGIFVIEDAAQAIDSYYNGKPLGSIGHLGAFSFHETKNIISGEGGMLLVNDDRFLSRSEIIWEKGTNRAAFSRREVSRYSWIDVGSSYLPSELTAAFLLAQLERLENIQKKRKEHWEYYFHKLQRLQQEGKIMLPELPAFATNNAHIFYLITRDLKERDQLLRHLKYYGIQAIFHYVPLHESPFYKSHEDIVNLPNSTRYGETLVRLPLFFELTHDQIDFIVKKIFEFFNSP